MGLFKDSQAKTLENALATLAVDLNKIYSNKSSDEYKMAGDITKSKVYSGIETMIANLSQLKYFSKNDARELKIMFNALHRPIYKKLVKEYIHQADERNTMFTLIFTCGYRTLVGELSRIFASTEATEKGLIYKPDKISRSKDASRFIKAFNNNMEQKVDEMVRESHKSASTIQTEYFVQEGLFTVIGTGVKAIAGFVSNHHLAQWMSAATGVFDFIFGARSELNPISYMNHLLTNHYDKKVASFYSAEKMYEEAKKAYDEYMKIPESNRNKKIESNYVKLIKKYNIKMENLRAQIAHYDSRAMVEVKEKAKKSAKPKSGNGNAKGNDNENKPTKPTSMDTTDKDVNTPTNNADDLDW